MDEAAWLCSEDPQAMLAHVQDKVSPRRLRLFACVCCRSVWASLNESERKTVAEAEKYVESGKHKRLEFSGSVQLAVTGLLMSQADVAANGVLYLLREGERAFQTALLREVVGNPFRPVTLPLDQVVRRVARVRAAGSVGPGVVMGCSWLTPAVLSLAQAAYAGEWDSLGPLSDALEEGGCDSEGLLAHLRSAGPHVKGCWAVDLLLGKE